MIELLIQAGQPLSAELQRWLAPWLTEIEFRRQQVVLEARQAEANCDSDRAVGGRDDRQESAA